VASSPLHPITTVIGGVSGELSVNWAEPEKTATGTVRVNVSQLQSGGRVRDWNVRRHLDVKQWPESTFELETVSLGSQEPWVADIRGVLTFRGQTQSMALRATTDADEERIVVHSDFPLCLPEWGLTPPRFLVLKVEDVVSVHVHLYASARGC